MRRSESGQRDLRSIGAIVFGIAVVMAAVLIWMGVSGVPWPKWLLALAGLF